MFPSPEWSLIVFAYAIYLFDSVQNIKPGEGLLEEDAAKWKVHLGLGRFQLRGKYLDLCSPLFPTRPLFRVSWVDVSDQEISDITQKLIRHAEAVQILRIPMWIQFFGMFVLLPCGLLSFSGWVVILLIALLYANAVFAIYIASQRRLVLKISRKQLFAIGLECLLCIPLSVNFLRKISLNCDPANNMIEICRHLMDEQSYEVAAYLIGRRIDEALEIEEEGSNGYKELCQLLNSLRVRSV